MTHSESAAASPQTDLISPEYAQLLLPKFTDDQLDTLVSYGTIEPTAEGEVLVAAGDLTYDLMVVLQGEVECFDSHDGHRRRIMTHRARDFIAELNLLTRQRLYVSFVVTRAGSILRVPRQTVLALIEANSELGELLMQTMFRRRQALLLMGSGVQIVGSRYSPDTVRLREFAARNRLAYNWVDLDEDPAGPALLQTLGFEPRQTPVVLLGGSAVLANPSNAELAASAGVTDQPQSGSVYDVLIIGAGPAGLAAAVYGATEGLSTAVVDAVAAGGQASTTSRIENYLGFPVGVSGEEFGQRASLQAQRLGAQMFVPDGAVSLSHREGLNVVTLDNSAELLGKAVIIATGVTYRHLEVSGIDRFEALGVFYSPIDAGHLDPGEPVAIVGAGNSAGQAATALAAGGHRVFMIVRGAALADTMSTYLLDRIEHDQLISVETNMVIRDVRGHRRLESVVTENGKTGERSEIATHYLLVMIGAEPHTDWLADVLQRDDHGYIQTGEDIPPAALVDASWAAAARPPYLLETSLPGVFAIGDVRAHSVKRVAAAVGEGSMAVRFVQQYLGRAGV